MSQVSQLNAALAGRYEIQREVGAGGMATVFLARDLRHDRRVALKVLKPELGAVLGVERFLSEIKVTANLQHPNLLPLFDSGAAEGLLFYVMPFVEGESLRARLDREKQLPLDEALHIATAVASALDYAHRQGVIHRDLKPENILLHEGQPLVADFGIALAVSNAGGGRITQTGLSLGTPQYMSPEQATGDRAIDGRTDIYSLGAVTYEMLTGEAPHVGSTSQAIIARVLTEKPRSVRSSRPSVPAHVEATVDNALQKLPADRFATAREFADGLSGKRVVATTNATSAFATDGSAPGQRTRLERGLMATSGVLSVALVILAAIAVRGPAPPPEPPEIRFDLATPSSSGPLQVGASPDGQTVVFGVTTASGNSIWSRPIGSPEAGPISGTEGALNGAWSPDSRQIAFVVQGKLKRVPASGGTPETICDAAGTMRGASWNADNVIVFSRDGEIYRVPAIGGVPVKLPLEAPGSSRWEYPWFLPDGERFLLLARGGDANTRGVYVASLEAGTPVRLGAAETRVAFAQPDQLLFVRDDALYAQTLDTRKLQLVGEPVRIADDVGANLINGVAGFGVSQTGMLVHRGSATFGTRQLRWYTRDGTPRETIGDSANIWEFALAPDGRRVAFTSRVSIARTADVWTVDLASNITSRLTADSVGVRGVLWSRDSRSVTFGKDGSESPLHAKRVGDATDSIVYKPDGTTTLAEDYSPDSRTLLIRRPDTLLALPLSGDRKPVVLAVIRGVDEVRFSPDGRRVSYGTNVDDRQIYVADYPALDNRRQVSANGGRQARWRGDGKELYFLDPGGKVMVAAVRPGSATEFLAPTVLFQSPLANPSSVTDQFDVTRDGQRFLFAVSTDGSDATSASLSVLFNWQNALKK